jgi:hypothetical protein
VSSLGSPSHAAAGLGEERVHRIGLPPSHRTNKTRAGRRRCPSRSSASPVAWSSGSRVRRRRAVPGVRAALLVVKRPRLARRTAGSVPCRSCFWSWYSWLILPPPSDTPSSGPPLHAPVALLDGLLVVVLRAKALEVGGIQIPTALGPVPDVVDGDGLHAADRTVGVRPEMALPGRPPPTSTIERRPAPGTGPRTGPIHSSGCRPGTGSCRAAKCRCHCSGNRRCTRVACGFPSDPLLS